MNNTKIFKKTTRVGLADDKTVVTSDTAVELSLRLYGESDSIVYTGEFIVLDMEGNDIIIGLPAILGDLCEFFKTNVDARKALDNPSDYLDQQVDMESFDEENPVSDIRQALASLMQPWTHDTTDEAPEEKYSPLPTNFGDIS